MSNQQGPRYVRMPEPLYYPEEAELIRSVVGKNSVSAFIRDAVVKAAKAAKKTKR